MSVVRSAVSAVSLVLLLTACGKVGSPLPPIVRIPEPVANLAAAQSGYRVILSWTNPARYVDGNAATDLGMIHILRNGTEAATVAATTAGQVQTYEFDVTRDVGAMLTFALQFNLPGVRRTPAPSNTASIQPVDVPGTPRNLRLVVDQFRIFLEWDAPERNANLAESYVVQRSDRPAVSVVNALRFEDADYERDKMYTYTVAAARGRAAEISGVGNISGSLQATDTTAPAIPVWVGVEQFGAGVFLRWRAHTERDFKDILVYRSDSPNPLPPSSADGLVDNAYRPGLTYQLVARDIFDNVSQRSVPQAGP